MAPRQKIKHSTFGTYAGVKKVAACAHEPEAVHGVIFDHIKVDARCRKCGTYYAAGCNWRKALIK